mmetsp:Transcript_27441/g.59077  ORF Transcript_27441/g.59077 Transcript_27441/m.59077 type:complete len:97 (-) Transcript_27441:20-310(-)
MRLRISNTCNLTSRGEHWFTLAYSIKPRGEQLNRFSAARRSVCSYCQSAHPIGGESLQLCAKCGDEGVHFRCMAREHESLGGQSRAYCDSCALSLT